MVNSSIITLGLAALCAGLGWQVYEEASRPVPSGQIVLEFEITKKSKSPEKSERTAVILPPIDAFGETVSRPLFNVSRRPIVVDAPVPAVKQTELKVMLSGIVIGHAQQIAHIRSETDQQTRALSVGDKIDDWQVESILPDRVVLRSGARVETLFMQKPGVQGPARSQRDATGVNRNSGRNAKRPQRRSRRNYRRDRRRREN